MKIQYLTVQALTKYIKRKFDFDPHLQNVYVKGEISNFKRHTSGHMYFTLKDEKARIGAVMFAQAARSLKFIPENGMNVLLNGEVSVYEPSGQYQIYVKSMEPDGIGALYVAFEQLKERLEKEGLFRKDRKQPIPPYPKTVGVVTSPTGAAIRDIITTIQRRYPIARIIIYPALVQGTQAAPSVANMIRIANERKEADVLIVGRGGGSIEELWAFNEEVVARAIYESDIPIISAVGHETDTTIADFVADLRAPTPTGAAEMAVPNWTELLERIENRKIRMTKTIKERIRNGRIRLTNLEKSYAFRYPKKMYREKAEYLDRTMERATQLIVKMVAEKNQALQRNIRRLELKSPEQSINEARKKFQDRQKRLIKLADLILREKQKEFSRILQMLDALSPLKVMERGYSLVYSEGGTLIKTVEDVQPGDKVSISFYDGNISAQVLEGKEKKNHG